LSFYIKLRFEPRFRHSLVIVDLETVKTCALDFLPAKSNRIRARLSNRQSSPGAIFCRTFILQKIFAETEGEFRVSRGIRFNAPAANFTY